MSKLLDSAPLVPVSEIREPIEEELGSPVGDLFATLDDSPLASASIGQVHRATLHDGQAVVVKALRPDIEGEVDADLVLVDAVRLVRERMSPAVAGRRAVRTLRQAAELAQAFPRRRDDLWDQLEEGELTFGISVRRLEVVIAPLNSMVNRVAFSVVVAALVIGSALILHGGTDAGLLPILRLALPVAEITFLAAVGTAALLLISIVRSRNL